MSTSSATGTISLAELRDRVGAPVLGPDDAGYDEARAIMLGGSDPRPAVIVRPRGDADVARAITLAGETGLPLAVRRGGHSGAAHCTADGGMVIDLRDMKAVEFDLVAKTAWAEAGLTAAEFSDAAGAHGLAVGFGDTGSVGLGGITLGGGVGYLARKHGLTIDSLLAADVVTADGTGAIWDRLAAVKAAYDPQNVFRRNQNVPPATASGSIGQQTRRSRPVSKS